MKSHIKENYLFQNKDEKGLEVHLPYLLEFELFHPLTEQILFISLLIFLESAKHLPYPFFLYNLEALPDIVLLSLNL